MPPTASPESYSNITSTSGWSSLVAVKATRIAMGIATPLYSQIDPNRLGELRRAMRIAREYGERLNQTTQLLLTGALDKLISAYPSHSFVIDRKEAKELFTNVQSLSAEESAICAMLWKSLGDESGKTPIFLTSSGELS